MGRCDAAFAAAKDLHTAHFKWVMKHPMKDLEAYKVYAEMMLAAHEAIEARLAELEGYPVFTPIFRAKEMRTALESVKRVDDVATAIIGKLVDQVEKEHGPSGLMGLHYVFDAGSASGGQILRKSFTRKGGEWAKLAMAYTFPEKVDPKDLRSQLKEGIDVCDLIEDEPFNAAVRIAFDEIATAFRNEVERLVPSGFPA